MNAWNVAALTAAGMAVVFLAACPVGAVDGWTEVAVPNGDFETSGPDTSWSDGGAAGLSTAGANARNILPGWAFAAGYVSASRLGLCSRVIDPVDAAGHGQVAQMDFWPNGTRKVLAGYISSSAIPGITVEASRYRMDVSFRTTGSVYGINFGFLFGELSGFESVAPSVDYLNNATEGGNDQWGAPYEMNSSHNSYVNNSSWTHVRIYWDNTGTETETFELTNAINPLPNGVEGFTTPETLPDGTVAIAYYTNQRGLGQALRLGAKLRANYGGESLFIDNVQLAVEGSPPPPVPQYHPGDANGDGVVDLQDFGALKDHFGLNEGASWDLGDFNADGAIDLQDFGILKDHFGHTAGDSPVTAVPEPCTALLLLAGAGVAGRRRR